MADLILIGELGRPHGVRGGIRARATGATLATLRAGDEVELRPRGGAPRTLRLAALGGDGDRPILAFDGVPTREAAAELVGATIHVDAGRVAPIRDPDTFYVTDLIGCAVLLGDRPVGKVAEVQAAPANDVIAVDGPDGRLLVPFTADAVVAVDLRARRIAVRADLFED
ncbi:MAG: ribosome maturation factor RimM [Thermoleophilia bacterium]